MIKFKNSYNPMVLESPQQKLNQLHKQTLNNVPYHGKYSFMPKGVQRQSEIDSYNIQNENFIFPKIERLAGIDRKNRSNIKFLDSQKEPSKIILTKSKTLKKENQMGFQGIEMSQNIPVFQNKQLSKNVWTTRRQSKLSAQRIQKVLWRKFTRLDRESKTIDMSKSANEEHDQLFKSRRYLKDQDESINQSFAGSRSIDKSMRRLALSKIKGKYSTLDQYSYHED